MYIYALIIKVFRSVFNFWRNFLCQRIHLIISFLFGLFVCLNSVYFDAAIFVLFVSRRCISIFLRLFLVNTFFSTLWIVIFALLRLNARRFRSNSIACLLCPQFLNRVAFHMYGSIVEHRFVQLQGETHGIWFLEAHVRHSITALFPILQATYVVDFAAAGEDLT